MIIVSQFNVYPNEIEEVLSSHPSIREAAVISVPSEKSGEKIKAFIIKKDKSLTEEDVLRFFRNQLRQPIKFLK